MSAFLDDDASAGVSEAPDDSSSRDSDFGPLTSWTNTEYQLFEWRVARNTQVDRDSVRAASDAVKARGAAADFPLALQALWADDRRRRPAAALVGTVAVLAGPAAGAEASLADDEPEAEAEDEEWEGDASVESADKPSRVVRVEPPVPVPGDMVSLSLVPINDPGFRAVLPLPMHEFTRRSQIFVFGCNRLHLTFLHMFL